MRSRGYMYIISIHAPLAGSDKQSSRVMFIFANFNPRSPRGERRETEITLIVGGNFNPRSPRGERRLPGLCAPMSSGISIHAPLAGSDGVPPVCVRVPATFQSTLPSRGATVALQSLPFAPRRFQSTLPSRGATEISHILIASH